MLEETHQEENLANDHDLKELLDQLSFAVKHSPPDDDAIINTGMSQ